MNALARPGPSSRPWALDAIACIEADARRSADTHLVTFPLPSAWNIDLYLKDESTHPTGSLKHRLARSLFLYGLCNGWINEGVTIIEASSGSTAVSEAYFARMLDVPFVAVVPSTVSPEKLALIEQQGGRCHVVTDASSIYAESARLAAECGGLYIDQFTYAERATDWRGNNNIAEMLTRGQAGSVVTLICDGGERYRHSYYDSEWLASHGLDLAPAREALEDFLATGMASGLAGTRGSR